MKFLFQSGGILQYGDSSEVFPVESLGCRLANSAQRSNLLIDGNGRLYVLALKSTADQIYLFYSDNQGQTWTPVRVDEFALYAMIVCDMCLDSQNRVHIAWVGRSGPWGIWQQHRTRYRMWSGSAFGTPDTQVNWHYDQGMGISRNVGIACNDSDRVYVASQRHITARFVGVAEAPLFATVDEFDAVSMPNFGLWSIGADFHLIKAMGDALGVNLEHRKYVPDVGWSYIEALFATAGQGRYSVVVVDDVLYLAVTAIAPSVLVTREYDGTSWTPEEIVFPATYDRVNLGYRSGDRYMALLLGSNLNIYKWGSWSLVDTISGVDALISGDIGLGGVAVTRIPQVIVVH